MSRIADDYIASVLPAPAAMQLARAARQAREQVEELERNRIIRNAVRRVRYEHPGFFR